MKRMILMGTISMLFFGCANNNLDVSHKKEVKKYNLNIITVPQDSNILIDSQKYTKNMKLKEGNYSIKISKKYYFPVENNITLNKNLNLYYKLKFVDADKIEEDFNKKIDGLVYGINNNFLIFTSYDNLITYAVAKMAMGKDLSAFRFRITDSIFGGGNNVFNRQGSLEALLNLNYPFVKISMLANKLTDMYVNSLPPLPNNIVSVPLPKFTKSQFETQKMFQARVKKEIAKRDSKIRALEEKYNVEIEKRNAELEYIHNIVFEKRKKFQKIALKLLMGNFYLSNPKYDAETETMYVTLKLSRSVYQKRIALNVPLNIAEDFYYHLKDVKVKASFDFSQYNIMLENLKATYKGQIFVLKNI